MRHPNTFRISSSSIPSNPGKHFATKSCAANEISLYLNYCTICALYGWTFRPFVRNPTLCAINGECFRAERLGIFNSAALTAPVSWGVRTFFVFLRPSFLKQNKMNRPYSSGLSWRYWITTTFKVDTNTKRTLEQPPHETGRYFCKTILSHTYHYSTRSLFIVY